MKPSLPANPQPQPQPPHPATLTDKNITSMPPMKKKEKKKNCIGHVAKYVT